MKVLVTGASGRIGKALCDELLTRGDEVVGLTRDPEKAGAAQPQVTWHAWEPLLERPADAAFEGVDGVVNLVGEKINQRWTDAAKRKIMDSRKLATHNLAGAIEGLARKPRVLVSQSAVGYYGSRGDETLDESSAPGKGFDAEICIEWEQAARAVEAAGVRLVIVRTGQVMETGGGLLGELLLPFKLGLGGPGSSPGRSTPRASAASSTPPRRIPSPTRSGRRLWDGRSTVPPCCRSRASRRRSNSAASSARWPRVGSGCCRNAPRSSGTRSSSRKSTARCGIWSGRPVGDQLGSSSSWTDSRTFEVLADSTALTILVMPVLPEGEVTSGMPADSRIARANLLPGPGGSRVATALVSWVARREFEPLVARSTPPPARSLGARQRTAILKLPAAAPCEARSAFAAPHNGAAT
jgi:NAD dependent epimerase/dehydratase family